MLNSAFLWQSEPATFFLRFGRAEQTSIDSTAILFPIISRSWMSRSRADLLLTLGLCSERGTLVIADFEVQGVRKRHLEFQVPSRMPKTPLRGQQASVLLGLNFIPAFGSAEITIDGEQGSVRIG